MSKDTQPLRWASPRVSSRIPTGQTGKGRALRLQKWPCGGTGTTESSGSEATLTPTHLLDVTRIVLWSGHFQLSEQEGNRYQTTEKSEERPAFFGGRGGGGGSVCLASTFFLKFAYSASGGSTQRGVKLTSC